MEFQPQPQQPAIVKSGWLWRQSSILKQWKRKWFVLWNSGRLMWYDKQESTIAEDSIHIPLERAEILSASACGNVHPPEAVSNDCLFGVKTWDKEWHLAAENTDESMAWQLSLQEVKANAFVPIPPPAAVNYAAGPAAYPYQVHGYGSPGYSQYTVYSNNGTPNNVVVIDGRPVSYPYAYGSPYRYRRGCHSDAGLGFAAGASLGLLASPLFFWPFWWC